MNQSSRQGEPIDQELRRARDELARLGDVERELLFWRARAEAAEAVAAEWRTVQNRSLWKVFAALDGARARIAPPHSRRERIFREAARAAARAVAPLSTVKPQLLPPFEPKGHKDVLYVYDEPGAWKFYRCDHQAEELAVLGLSCDIAHSAQIDYEAVLPHYGAFMLNRVELTDALGAFIDTARAEGKTVVFGTDDLLFEPDLVDQFSFLDSATDADRAAWRERLVGYRGALVACAAAIVSTDALAEAARRHVDDVRVVYNAVSESMVRAADAALAHRPRPGRRVTVGYLSGTPSHNRDFLEAADAVVSALASDPSVRFLVVGRLDLDERFDEFGARVIRVPKQRFSELPKLAAQVDINLAPLERGNPFTECKSCVKYLEAGLVGVPTIASARPDFVRVINPGVNGVLADNPADWAEALHALVESPDRRQELGGRAAEDVRRNHTTKAIAPLLAGALREPRPRAAARPA